MLLTNIAMPVMDGIAKPFTLTEICDKVEEGLKAIKESVDVASTTDFGLGSKNK